MSGNTPPMHLAAIALGSNLSSAWGDREATLREAIVRVQALGTVQKVSSLYETEPVGYWDQPRFLNGALLLATRLGPIELLRELLRIEQSMGRNRSGTIDKGPRIVDLDLLLFDDLVIESTELSLPHPAMTERRFVLQPLAEIAPSLRHPLLKVTVADLLADLG